MSGKKVKAERKARKAKEQSLVPDTIILPDGVPELAKPATTLKLDLACGQNCREGFEGVDLPGVPGVKHELNLLKFPWPWADNSVLELHCSHFVEHIPTEFVDEFGNYVPCGTPGAKDLFFKFFDECYRVLVPEGWMTIIVPCLRNNRAFQDPTHRRFYPYEAFLYLMKNFRDINKLDHYNVQCNFDGKIDPTVTQETNARSPEVQERMFRESWNAIVDWHVKLKAIK